MAKVQTEKREKILQSALKLFIERGFHNTPTSLIAKEAGVATGTLFHHFSSKVELFNELYLSVKRKMVNGIKSGYDDNASLEEKTKYICLYSINWMVMHPDEFRFFKEFGNSPIISKITKQEAMNLFEHIMGPITELFGSNIIKNVHQEFIMDYLEGMMYTTVMHFRKYPEYLSEDNINRIFDIYWNGLAK